MAGGHLRLPVRCHRGVVLILHRELALALGPPPRGTCQAEVNRAAPASASSRQLRDQGFGIRPQFSNKRASSLPYKAYDA